MRGWEIYSGRKVGIAIQGDGKTKAAQANLQLKISRHSLNSCMLALSLSVSGSILHLVPLGPPQIIQGCILIAKVHVAEVVVFLYNHTYLCVV